MAKNATFAAGVRPENGFRANRSTSMAVIRLIEKILTAIDNRKLKKYLREVFDTFD